jgi:ATP sulfurylase
MVYRTTDADHPGVAALYRQGDVLLGGEVDLLREPDHGRFPGYYYTPAELRAAFAEKGLEAGRRLFRRKPRPPGARVHPEECPETVDGLLLNPLVGETKSDDIPRTLGCGPTSDPGQVLPERRTMLAVYRRRCAMRSAGGISHASAARTYGCTHFIVAATTRRGQLLRSPTTPAHLRGVRAEELGIHHSVLSTRSLLHGVRMASSERPALHDPSARTSFSSGTTKVS